jgi:hypothetical protein
MKKHSGASCPRCKDADFVEIIEVSEDTVRLRCASCLLKWNEPATETPVPEDLRSSRHRPEEMIARKP